jgi:GTP-binding protein Era
VTGRAADLEKELASKCGYVAIVGPPNVGKSTLLNRLIGQKLAITTRKVQTTRTRILGIDIINDTQAIYIDTPGLFKAKDRLLDRAMIDMAVTGAQDGDILAVMMDAARSDVMGDLHDTLDYLPPQNQTDTRHQKRVLILNKIDRVSDKDELLPLTQKLINHHDFDRVFMISALKDKGVHDFRDYVADELPAGPWQYPADQVSDIPLRQLAAEITREKLYQRLHDELPYASMVKTDEWIEEDDESVTINQTIFVQKQGQKGIVIGKGGSMIKIIGTAARKEMQRIMDRRIHLHLFVKVQENWPNQPEHLAAGGMTVDE